MPFNAYFYIVSENLYPFRLKESKRSLSFKVLHVMLPLMQNLYAKLLPSRFYQSAVCCARPVVFAVRG